MGGVSQIGGAARSEGDLNLGFTSRDTPEAVGLNRERFLALLCRPPQPARLPWGLVTLKQMHSGLARRVGRAEIAERASLWGDGLLTDEPGVLLGIQTADCLPVLIADRTRQAVAAFHAGWRGTLKGIVERGVASMRREFGSQPADLIAAIGPGIGQCCFAVGAEVRELFGARYSYAERAFYRHEKLASRPGKGQSPPTVGFRPGAGSRFRLQRMHQLPDGPVLLLSSGARQDGADAGCDRHRPVLRSCSP